MSANSTISATAINHSEILTFPAVIDHRNRPILTPVLTVTKKRKKTKRFQRVSKGLFRFNRTGTLYGVFKVNGRTRWKCLETDDLVLARQRLSDEINDTSQIDWRQAETVTVQQLIQLYERNPMGLAESTLRIRKQLLNVFKRTWQHGLGIKAREVKPIMLKSWLASRKQEQALKASGLNNYVRLLHGLFQLAFELEAVAESPAIAIKIYREESPERLTPTWTQAKAIIGAVKRQNGKNVLSAMLLLGLGQAELANLYGEHFDFERKQITIRRQKTQKIFVIPMYPQAKALLKRLKADGRIVPEKPLFDRISPRETISLACKRLGYPQFSP
ncbi:MAG TPA: site-specific integrase, partial [Verrucomicrobiae bacterium]